MTEKEWWRSTFERQLLEARPEQALRTLVDTQAISVAADRERAIEAMAKRALRYSRKVTPSLVATSDRAVSLLNAAAQQDVSRRGLLKEFAGIGHSHTRLHVGEPVRLKHTLVLSRGLFGYHANSKRSGATCIAQGSFGFIEPSTSRRSLLNRGGLTVRFALENKTRQVHFTPQRAAASLELGYACRGHDLPYSKHAHNFAQVFIERQGNWLQELATVSRAVKRIEAVITRAEYQGLEPQEIRAATPRQQASPIRHQPRNTLHRDGQQGFGL